MIDTKLHSVLGSNMSPNNFAHGYLRSIPLGLGRNKHLSREEFDFEVTMVSDYKLTWRAEDTGTRTVRETMRPFRKCGCVSIPLTE